MFWKRNQEVSLGDLKPLNIPPMPARKPFETMLEILKDAEKYDNAEEPEVRNATLNNLCEYIDSFIKSSKPLESTGPK